MGAFSFHAWDTGTELHPHQKNDTGRKGERRRDAAGRRWSGPSSRPADAEMLNSGLLQLLAEMRGALLRFLQLRGASPADAEDILQEVHVKLLAEKIGPVAEPRAYLYKMASNIFSGSRRTADRRARREEGWQDVYGGTDGERDERPSIETELIAREQLAILQRVMDRLPERTRVIFRRFRVDGEAQRAIAQDLGISVSAVEKHLARAYADIAAAKLRLDAENPGARHPSVERGRHGN